MLELVVDDDAVSASWVWDAGRKRRTSSRSRKLPICAAFDLMTKQMGESG